MSSDGGSSDVVKFYRGSTVLITGASGFLGQVMLEKILRSLDVKKVYLVIRAKKNSSAKVRLQRILQGTLFDKVREDPTRWSKVKDQVAPVEIDLDDNDNLIAEALKTELLEEVEIVFNLLASINFNEPLECALKTNVEYTDKLLGLVGQMKRLRSVVHVSTFYSNCDRDLIEERLYDDIGFGGYANIMNIVAKLDESEAQRIAPLLIGNFPNTYTFSKKCAEVMVAEKYRSLPIGIFRPPIVGSTLHEPIPGWIDNFNGPSGMVVLLSEGLYSAVLLDTRKRPFIVPVDYCVNAMLVCAVDICKQRSLPDADIPVYNYTSSHNALTWKEIIPRMYQGLGPFKHLLAICLTATVTRNPVRYAISKALMRVEGYLLDLVRRMRGRDPVMGKIFERMICQCEVLRFFTFNEWRMTNPNMERLWAEAGKQPAEASVFPFDLTKVDWDEYYRNFVPGVVKYAIEPRKVRAGALEPAQQEGGGKASWFAVWSFMFRYFLKIYKSLFG